VGAVPLAAARRGGAAPDLLAERKRFADGEAQPSDYIGVAGEFVTRLLAEARKELE